jgi:hypothetical protein
VLKACHNSLVSDESGTGRAPRPGRAALIALAAVVVTAVAVPALRRGVEPPEPSPSPVRSPAASIPPTPSLAFDDVCRPVRTTSPTRLDVSFSLRNNGSAPVALVAVEPERPLAGLLERGYTIRAGHCPATGRTLTDNRLGRARPVRVAPGASVVATLHYALPAECPKPYPVLVVVTESRGGKLISTDYSLLPDLNGVAFAAC